jgi:hypothetical protein
VSQELFEAGSAVLFMKIGTHAQESLPDIIGRKKREIEQAGFGLWGYGGNTCHPRTMVQPFAQSHAGNSGRILLCMQPMASKHFAEPLRAEEYSSDGSTWQDIPEAINVLGSRYALCIDNLREVSASLGLAGTRVAIGNSKGKRGNQYIKGRVDKACLEVVEPHTAPALLESAVDIGLVAELVPPFAVFLR